MNFFDAMEALRDARGEMQEGPNASALDSLLNMGGTHVMDHASFIELMNADAEQRAHLVQTNDQVGLAFARSQAAQVYARVINKKYPEIVYRDLIPIDSSGNEAIESVIYESENETGKAGFIGPDANDFPTVDVTQAESATVIRTGGLAYIITMEELARAALVNRPLEPRKAAAVNRKAQRFIDRFALTGSGTKNTKGLFNQPTTGGTAVNRFAATETFDDAGKTPTEMLADLHKMFTTITAATNGVGLPNTFLLPNSVLDIIAQTVMPNDAGETVLSVFRRTNRYTQVTGQQLTIKGHEDLETAGTSGSKRAVLYMNDEDNLTMPAPMPFRFLPTFQTGVDRYLNAGKFRIGELTVFRPKEICYADAL